MKTLKVLAAWVLMSATAAAYAHAHLHKSTPADGSTVTSPPSSVALSFSEAARLTAAWIQKGDEPRQKLGPLPEKSAADVSIPLPPLAPGRYTVSWRVVADDSHVMPGEIHFIVAARASSNQAAH